MGVIYMLLASACFTTMSALVKAVGPDLPLVQLVFLRCLIAIPILFAFVIAHRRPLVVKAKKLLVARSVFGMTAMYCFFYALTHMPLADCVFIGRTQPLLLALLAPFVLGEKTPRVAWLAIGTGVVGVAIIMKPAMTWPIAAWVALAAATLAAGAHMLVRRLNRTDYPLVIVFNFTVLTALVSAFLSVPVFKAMSGRLWLLTAGIAVFASLGQLLMTQAYRRDRAPVVAAASYSSVILSVIYGYLFWDELPHPLAWLGGGLIVAGGLLLLKSRFRIEEPAAEEI